MFKMEEPVLAPFRRRLPVQLRVLPRLLRRREVLPFRLRAILFRHPRRATLAEVPAPAAEAAVGAALLPLRAQAARGDHRRRPLRRRRRLRTLLPGARTDAPDHFLGPVARLIQPGLANFLRRCLNNQLSFQAPSNETTNTIITS